MATTTTEVKTFSNGVQMKTETVTEQFSFGPVTTVRMSLRGPDQDGWQLMTNRMV